MNNNYDKVVYRVGEIENDEFRNQCVFFAEKLEYFDYSQTGYDKEDAQPYLLNTKDFKVFDPMKQWSKDLDVESWAEIRTTEEFCKEVGLEPYISDYFDEIDYDDPNEYHEVLLDTDSLAMYGRDYGYDLTILRDIPGGVGYNPKFTEYAVHNSNCVKRLNAKEFNKNSFNVNEAVEKSIDEFELGTCGYVKEDGTLIELDEYHGEEESLRDKKYPEFSNTHPEEDTCIRIFSKPNQTQYEVLEKIIDKYLDSEGYCKIEVWESLSKYNFYKVFSLWEGSCDDYSWNEQVGNWTGYKLVQQIKNYFSNMNESLLLEKIKPQLMDKLKSLGYNIKYINEGWYDNNGNIIDWEDDREDPEDDWYYVDKPYYLCKNNYNQTTFSWRIDESSKVFTIVGIYGNYEKSTKGFASKTLDEVLKLIPSDDWTIEIENDINHSYWAHIQDKYQQYNWKEVYESLNEDILNEYDNEGHQLSKEQSEFFKNSKVRDEQGRLLVCYHGTNSKFDVFDSSNNKGHGTFGDGFYFTSNKYYADEYGDVVIMAYLNATNIFYIGNESDTLKLKSYLDNNHILYRWSNGYFNDNPFECMNVDECMSAIKKLGYDCIQSWSDEFIVFNSNQIKSIQNKKPSNSDNINESLLLEKTKQQLIDKSKHADNYSPKNQSKGKNRYERRRYSQISNSVRTYNKIDMDAFFKRDILNVGVEVRGETDTYTVSLRFDGVLQALQNEVKHNNNKLEFKCVYRAISNTFASRDIKVDCSCPDFMYRIRYFDWKNGDGTRYEPRPSDITNPNDSKGAGCKHILLVLANRDWVMKVASVVNNYIKYCEKNLQNNYATYMFPKIYGMPYNKAVQLNLFDTGILPSDQKTVGDIASTNLKDKDELGRWSTGNSYRFQKTKQEVEKPNPNQQELDLKFGKEKTLKVDDEVETEEEKEENKRI